MIESLANERKRKLGIVKTHYKSNCFKLISIKYGVQKLLDTSSKREEEIAQSNKNYEDKIKKN